MKTVPSSFAVVIAGKGRPADLVEMAGHLQCQTVTPAPTPTVFSVIGPEDLPHPAGARPVRRLRRGLFFKDANCTGKAHP